MEAFDKMLKYYGMDRALFGIGGGDSSDTNHGDLTPSAELVKLMKSIPEGKPLGPIMLRPADGTIFEPGTGEVLSENNPILPNPFGIDAESCMSFDAAAGSAHDIPLQNVCEAEALIPSEAVPGDTAPPAPAEIQFNWDGYDFGEETEDVLDEEQKILKALEAKREACAECNLLYRCEYADDRTTECPECGDFLD